MALTRNQRIGGAVGLAVPLLAVPFEGVYTHSYKDVTGLDTVCAGHTVNVDSTRQYTLNECMALLDADMRAAVTAVENCWPNKLPVKSLAAFGDMAYNVGPRAVCDPAYSTLARKLRDNDIAGACMELPKWNKARVAGVLTPLPGLTKRREKEMQLCLEGVNNG